MSGDFIRGNYKVPTGSLGAPEDGSYMEGASPLLEIEGVSHKSSPHVLPILLASSHLPSTFHSVHKSPDKGILTEEVFLLRSLATEDTINNPGYLSIYMKF